MGAEKVIITGGTEGIGRGIILSLLQENPSCLVSTCARNRKGIMNLLTEVPQGKVFAEQADLMHRTTAKNFATSSVNNLGGVDTVILNAAVTGAIEDPETVFRVNQVASIAIIRAVRKQLIENNGQIIFLTSSAKNVPGAEAYGSSKKRIEEWLEKFARQTEGIKIYFVDPGTCNTRIPKLFMQHGSPEARERGSIIKNTIGFRNPLIIGKIIASMARISLQYNDKSKGYNDLIQQCQTITISNANIQMEEESI